MLRAPVVAAICRRNLSSYFSGIIGYLFIVVFVVAGAILAFSPQFFANNTCNLDQLSAKFPLLLLFLIPAVTMTAWADEKKLGTEELLFTLPATDLEVLLGKYLAVLAVYTVTLAFSLTHVVVLAFLGRPDWGMQFATYCGYWFAGAALLAAGMFASVLTSSATVAFVLGAAFCALPVFLDEIPMLGSLREHFGIREPLSIGGQLKDFTLGSIPLSGVVYFLSITVVFLYLNLVMIGRRHWGGGKDSDNLTIQFGARVLSLAVIVASVTYVFALLSGGIDCTSERLFTLSPVTQGILKNLPEKRPVTIQAFISPDVPEEYVSVQKKLLTVLKELDKEGGSKVTVRFVNTEPLSPQSQEAQKLGIQRLDVRSERQGRATREEIYLGAVVSSGFDQIVIPAFNRGTPVEYELARSLGTVSKEKRATIGLLTTDASVGGGFDRATFRQKPAWRLATELKKQYTVREVDPDKPIDGEGLSCLIAVMPSSLTVPQMENFVTYVKQGKAVLIFDDPLPGFDPRMAAADEMKPNPAMNPMFGQMSPPPQKKGNIEVLLRALDLNWNTRKVLFDTYSPIPRSKVQFPDQLLILAASEDGSQAPNGINPTQTLTKGLQQILAWYSGTISARDPKKSENETPLTFTPLLQTQPTTSGTNDYKDFLPDNFGDQQAPKLRTDDESHVIAAWIRSSENDKLRKINVIFVADTDLVHDVMFQVSETLYEGFSPDNVMFVLNCVDGLADNEQLVALRNRRAQQRKLLAVDKTRKQFEVIREEAVKNAEVAADNQIKKISDATNAKLQELQKSSEDDAELGNRAVTLIESVNREMAREQAKIKRERDEMIRKGEIDARQKILAAEERVRWFAVGLPPLPAILLGLFMLSTRLLNEQRGIAADRLVRR